VAQIGVDVIQDVRIPASCADVKGVRCCVVDDTRVHATVALQIPQAASSGGGGSGSGARTKVEMEVDLEGANVHMSASNVCGTDLNHISLSPRLSRLPPLSTPSSLYHLISSHSMC